MDLQTIEREVTHAEYVADRAQLALSLARMLKLQFETGTLNPESFEYIGFAYHGIALTLAGTPEEQRTTLLAVKRLLNLGEGTKQKTWDGKGLNVAFTDGMWERVNLTLCGYVPPTCKTVKKTRVIKAVAAQPERIEEYEELVCEREGNANDETA